MCLNCQCLDGGFCFGDLSYIIERLAQCVALTAVVSCLMVTLMIMLGLGVGVGYNYCFVETKLNETLASGVTKAKPDLRMGEIEEEEGTTSKVGNLARQRRSKEETDDITTEDIIKPTMVIPLHRIGLVSLLTRIQKRNKNVTLELISFNATTFN